MVAHDPALQRLIDQVRAASAAATPLEIRGGGSKRFYGESPRGAVLDVSELSGISCYEPTELVVTARAGTPLSELESTLLERGQYLPFEPPRFAAGGTVGGMVAAGLAGPARASVGGVRDFVLGATLLNGRGETMTFGGQVMKNVAGYDISRLLAGSLGILGVICELSLKVLPLPRASASLRFECDEQSALRYLNQWAGQPLSLNAGTWHDGRLTIRVNGAAAAVQSACAKLGGELLDPVAADAWWHAVRDHQHVFFALDDAVLAAGESLWRLSVPATAAPLGLAGEQFIDWCGAQRWWRTRAAAAEVRAAAAAVGGHATLFRAGDKSPGVFAPLSPPLELIHRRLKQEFDPEGIFNPGRLYPNL